MTTQATMLKPQEHQGFSAGNSVVDQKECFQAGRIFPPWGGGNMFHSPIPAYTIQRPHFESIPPVSSYITERPHFQAVSPIFSGTNRRATP